MDTIEIANEAPRRTVRYVAFRECVKCALKIDKQCPRRMHRQARHAQRIEQRPPRSRVEIGYDVTAEEVAFPMPRCRIRFGNDCSSTHTHELSRRVGRDQRLERCHGRAVRIILQLDASNGIVLPRELPRAGGSRRRLRPKALAAPGGITREVKAAVCGDAVERDRSKLCTGEVPALLRSERSRGLAAANNGLPG